MEVEASDLLQQLGRLAQVLRILRDYGPLRSGVDHCLFFVLSLSLIIMCCYNFYYFCVDVIRVLFCVFGVMAQGMACACLFAASFVSVLDTIHVSVSLVRYLCLCVVCFGCLLSHCTS